MPVPKWLRGFLDYSGNLQIENAKSLKQRFSADENKDIMFGVAEIWEKKGQELKNIARQGTDEEAENAYHEMVHGQTN